MNKTKKQQHKLDRVAEVCIQLPLLVFILNIVWGTLKIDVGDQGPAAYGWLFVFFGVGISMILIAVGYTCGLISYSKKIRHFHKLSNWQQLWLSLGFMSFVVAMLATIIGNFKITMVLLALQLPITQVLAMALVLNLIATIALKFNFNTKIKRPNLMGVLPILLAGTIYSYHGINHQIFMTARDNKVVTEIKRYHQQADMPGQIKITNYADNIGVVNYSITDGQTKLFNTLRFDYQGFEKGRYQIETTALTSDEKMALYLQPSALSKAAKENGLLFKKTINQQLINKNLAKYFELDDKATYLKPKVLFNASGNSKQITQIAKHNQQSNQSPQKDFQGYTAISFEDAMQSQMIVVQLVLSENQSKISQLSKNGENLQAVKQQIRKAISQLSFSQLTDGIYLLDSSDELIDYQAFSIKNHQFNGWVKLKSDPYEITKYVDE